MINWNSNREDAKTIARIGKRASTMATMADVKYSVMDANMDVSATHLNGYPLKLQELLAADDFNFAHDIFGILNHIDRRTGQLQNCFIPRYAQ